MNGINKVNIMGRLGNDPDIGQLNNGGIVATLSIATSEVWTDKQNQKQERTEWHRVVFYGRTAEIAQQYLAKGRAVNVFGKLKTRQWQDKDGHTRYTTEIIGSELHMIDSGNANQGNNANQYQGNQQNNRQQTNNQQNNQQQRPNNPSGGNQGYRGNGQANQQAPHNAQYAESGHESIPF